MDINTPEKLNKENLSAADAFLAGTLWADFRRCLRAARPEPALPTDDPSTAAHKSFLRDGFEKCIDTIEALPYESGETEANPFARPATNPVD
jgi:hypothetical protein